MPEPVAIVSDLDQSAWDRYVLSHPEATRYHLWVWRGVFERVFGHETVYLAARRGERPVGVLPLVSFRSLLFGRFLVSLPFVNYGGVVADDGEVAQALVDRAGVEAAARRAAHVELRHTRRLCPGLAVRQHKVAMTLPLPGDEEAAWKGFDNKLRNAIRKAQKSGFETAVGGAELAGEFYAVFARNMRDLGTPVYSRRLFEEVLSAVPESRALVVRLRGAAVAAAITIGFRDTVENPWASSLREHRSSNPNMMLYWALIQDAIARGYRVFDFGRSTPGESTYRFKKQWGAGEAPFHWEYVMVAGGEPPDHGPTNPRFAAAIALWQRLPVAVANLLGPVIVRSIP